ncbi:MAG: molybdopterin-binding protein [Rhodovarius sp.]|nr:molybdopterin-binding protein [Rhodovarius sp.]MCX7932414.1 molybdopterin-binding protein [Rhodovarius sp.]MDW8314845.1 molybdopterin-binding protein [Rhodovarius sp.]
MTAEEQAENPTACVLIIGNEVLSGRTQDQNLRFLASELGALGIPVREARVIPDVEEMIVSTINEVRAKYTHVFTTGGIGPTHDDITSECVAKAFGVPWEPHPVAWKRLAEYYASQNPPGDFNAARQRMATMPRGAVLIENEATIAPGFSIGNVHVLAGVPRIMQAMFRALAPRLARGRPVVSATVHADGIFEGQIAAALAEVQRDFPMLEIGSYPYFRPPPVRGGVALVAKGTDADAVARAAEAMARVIAAAGGEPREGEPAPEP